MSFVLKSKEGSLRSLPSINRSSLSKSTTPHPSKIYSEKSSIDPKRKIPQLYRDLWYLILELLIYPCDPPLWDNYQGKLEGIERTRHWKRTRAVSKLLNTVSDQLYVPLLEPVHRWIIRHIRSDDSEAVKFILNLSSNFSPDQIYRNYYDKRDNPTCITEACRRGNLDTLKLLMERMNKGCGDSGLESAIAYGNVRVIPHLLSQTDVIDHERLMNSVTSVLASPNCAEVELLLKDGRFVPSDTTLCMACINLLPKLVERLLDVDGMMDYPWDVDNPIASVCETDQKNGTAAYGVISVLMRYPKMDPSLQMNRAIINAVKAGNSRIVKLLMKDSRVDPSVNHNWCLRNACKMGFVSIVVSLLQDPRVDPGSNNFRAVKIAKNWNIAQLLVKDERVSREMKINKQLRIAMKNLGITQKDL